MKIVLPSAAYAFHASSGQLDFSAATGFDFRRLLGIFNLKPNQLVYAIGIDGLGGSYSGTTLQLECDTAGMSDADPLTVFYDLPTCGVVIDRSGVITTSGGAQPLMPANPMRAGASFQNVSAGDLWINDLGDADGASPSHWIPTGAFLDLASVGNPMSDWSVWGLTVGQVYTAREW